MIPITDISKKAIFAVLIVLVIAICLFFSINNIIGRKPFKNLQEVTSATVTLTPPGETVQIVELSELLDYLDDVVIYNKDNSYTEYDGQGVVFNLILSSGTQMAINAYNPFVIIDGVGYRTKYEPCEALSSYANKLLNSEK